MEKNETHTSVAENNIERFSWDHFPEKYRWNGRQYFFFCICLTQSIIDKEKENYLAWVFTGAAAQELGNSAVDR